MSLILNNSSQIRFDLLAENTGEDQRSLEQLDRYLALVEDNRKASRFIPDDALLALDMAGFVREKLGGARIMPLLSTARMALSLAQGYQTLPVQ